MNNDLSTREWKSRKYSELSLQDRELMFVLQEQAYRKAGVGVYLDTFDKFDNKMKNRVCHLLLNDDQIIESYICSKRLPCAEKLTIFGYKPEESIKRITVKKTNAMLNEEGHLLEASDRVAELLDIFGVNKICDEKLASKLLEEQIKMDQKDCSYDKYLEGIGIKRKRLYGNPDAKCL